METIPNLRVATHLEATNLLPTTATVVRALVVTAPPRATAQTVTLPAATKVALRKTILTKETAPKVVKTIVQANELRTIPAKVISPETTLETRVSKLKTIPTLAISLETIRVTRVSK